MRLLAILGLVGCVQPGGVDSQSHGLVSIPAQSYTMGFLESDSALFAPHQVTLSAFMIDVTEVSQADYKTCVDQGGCQGPRPIDGYVFQGKRPVVGVTWSMADSYCRWAGKRLPTEAEWELAARGTDGRAFPWGSAAPTCSLANTAGCSVTATDVGTTTGDSPFGVHDMAGNVSEWVSDWFDSAYYGVSPVANPLGPPAPVSPLPALNPLTGYKVVRGGGFEDAPIRSFVRLEEPPTHSSFDLGFRCAL